MENNKIRENLIREFLEDIIGGNSQQKITLIPYLSETKTFTEEGLTQRKKLFEFLGMSEVFDKFLNGEVFALPSEYSQKEIIAFDDCSENSETIERAFLLLLKNNFIQKDILNKIKEHFLGLIQFSAPVEQLFNIFNFNNTTTYYFKPKTNGLFTIKDIDNFLGFLNLHASKIRFVSYNNIFRYYYNLYGVMLVIEVSKEDISYLISKRKELVKNER